jgi:hypothetical protein
MDNDGTDTHIENTVRIKKQKWTPEAQIILNTAGLESDFSYLHDWLKK